MEYLHNIFNNSFARKALAQIGIPNYITDNLKFNIRPYQVEALKRYIYIATEDFEEKPPKPIHLLYNMATGSGKTLIMAGLILYLYKNGYRDFLFFVNSNNVIGKTKDNFLNPQASKYLFGNKLVVDGKTVLINEVSNFEESDNKNINIRFTTIQQLHVDLNNTKENSITYEDFKSKKMVLIADEAHHLSSASKSNGDLFHSWEGTVLKTLEQNLDNLLLEFTATLDYESRHISEKYKDKVIYRYDLSQFRIDKYSKEINLVRSLYEEEDRILQALILNLYRQELAAENNINLKPVILFKAKRTIKESKKNKERFHYFIDNLTAKRVKHIGDTSTVSIVKKAFTFFKTKRLSFSEIAKRIKSNFRKENCISANNDTESELNQISLNTLEDENNPIRVVFAVQKLNEGWDVLNLFDIVRLYEGRDGRAGDPGKTTISEAQLVGRGARYFPFTIEESQDSYTRKYDDDIANDLKILEELYYHTKEDSRYISELKRALVNTGIYEDEDNLETKKLTLKLDFKNSEFYKFGKVVYNKKIEKNYDNVKSFSDLGVAKQNLNYPLSSGIGKISAMFASEEEKEDIGKTLQKDISIPDIPVHLIRYGLTKNPFYYFDNLEKYFPNVESLTNFIVSKDYLGGLEITFQGTEARLEEINSSDFLMATLALLQSIEDEIKTSLTEFEGSDYISEYIHNVFKDKDIRVHKGSEREDGQFDVVAEPEWYVYNANYGTNEEKEFVKLFARRFKYLNKKFKNIYLIRNEREVKIIDKFGRAFEPDFILFCKQKEGKELTFQVFVEPKGNHLVAHDKWKENFLKELGEEGKTINIDTEKYLITGVPFYNNVNENEFKETLEITLSIN